ncbi:MAG: ROK family protein, partial [Calditrichia bacterium]
MRENFAIGIDIGGTAIKYGICSDSGKIIAKEAIETPAESSKEDILQTISELIRKALQKAGENSLEIKAVGIGTPGSVDVNRGYLMGFTPNFTNWGEAAIAETLHKEHPLPIFVDNDANL